MPYPEAKDPRTNKAPEHQRNALGGKSKDISNAEVVPRSEVKKVVTYYSSHSPRHDSFTFGEFIEREVEDIENYTEEEADEWSRKYHLSPDTPVIWVTTVKWLANRYNLSSDEYDNAEFIPEDEMDVYEINSTDGVLIQESDDGDDGFLFAFNS